MMEYWYIWAALCTFIVIRDRKHIFGQEEESADLQD